MDPKDNASSSNGNDAQNNRGVPNDSTQNPDLGSPAVPPDVSVGGAPAPSDQNAPQAQGVEVDLSGAAGTSSSANPASSGVPGLGSDPGDPGAMPSIGGETVDTSAGAGSNPTDVAFGGTQDAGAGQSGLPTDATTPSPADQPFSSPDTPTTPDLTAAGNTSVPPSNDPNGPLPSIGADPGVLNQASAPGPEQQPGGIPPTVPAPAPLHGADKKTIIVLAGIAVVLIVAIVVLFLL